MRKGLLFLWMLVMILAMGVTTAYGTTPTNPTLVLDGEVLQTEDPPIIRSGRTLLPAKILFESMGGTVSWDADLRQTTIELGDTTVQLIIDSTTARVNGQEKELDVPATIINRRTYVPVAFAATELGCEVLWNATDYIVTVNSPKEPVQVTDISVQEEGDSIRVQLTANGPIDNYRSVAYEMPDRIVIDVKGAKLNFDDTDAAGSLGVATSVFTDVRYSQFDLETVRAVVDLSVKQAPQVSLSDDKTTIYVDFVALDHSDDGIIDNSGEGVVDTSGLAALNIPQLDWRMQGNLILIDPGHGGTDSGSLGYKNGTVVLQEKEINLKVATRLNELLQMAGATTYMTRTDDSTVGLYDRPEIANQMSAALFISCHNNSNDSSSPHGTEVHYSNKASEADYGYSSQAIATSVMDELDKSLGLQRRGAKNSPAYAVLRLSNMPAIIIEGAFMSNPSDLEYIMTDKYVEDYAQGAARGIIKALNEAAAKQ